MQARGIAEGSGSGFGGLAPRLAGISRSLHGRDEDSPHLHF
jgi:hypothetical protein